jgi:diadenosine tetraphosphate (Ap4A) HIT family hydrolase
MQHANQSLSQPLLTQNDCAFCERDKITDTLKETAHFLLAADYAPLVEGHLLVIPKQHYACYGDVPASLEAELLAIKTELRQFYAQFYDSVVFWEHGVFRQTVFHAHLHCFPWGNIAYDLASNVHSMVVTEQEDIRAWYRTQGHYFYLEDSQVALLFLPEMTRYMRIIQQVFQKKQAARDGSARMRSPQQRHAEGRPMIEATIARWKKFQQQKG